MSDNKRNTHAAGNLLIDMASKGRANTHTHHTQHTNTNTHKHKHTHTQAQTHTHTLTGAWERERKMQIVQHAQASKKSRKQHKNCAAGNWNSRPGRRHATKYEHVTQVERKKTWSKAHR